MTNATPFFYLLLNKPVDVRGNDATALITRESYLGSHALADTCSFAGIMPLEQDEHDVEGLLIFTNDTTLHQTIEQAEREYEIVISMAVDPASERLLERGMLIDDMFFAGFTIVKKLNKGKRSVITVITHHTAQHVRTMLTQLGYKPVSIKRTRINSLRLGTLPTGRWRLCKKDDMLSV